MTATAMKERPILMSAEMVRAILDGRKVQTRRLLKPQPDLICPFLIGMTLWVREAFDILDDPAAYPPGKPPRNLLYDAGAWKIRGPNGERWVVDYRADGPHTRIKDKTGARRWTPSIHMPRWASRITLEIVDVRIERLRSITEADAIDEGVEAIENPDFDAEDPCDDREFSHVAGFAELWDKLNAKSGATWASNPWVFVLTFKRVDP
jgi:hypothetical protein